MDRSGKAKILAGPGPGLGLALLLATGLLCGSTGAAEKREDTAYARNLAEGAAFLAQGRLPQALGRFKVARKLRPGDADAYYWLGLTWSELEDYPQAAKHAEKATILANDRSAQAFLLWGQSLLYMHDWAQAREKLEKAFRLAPDNHLVTFNLGRCYFFGLNDSHTALKFFRKTLDLNPKFAPARLYAGCCYRALDIPAPAITAFQQVLTWAPDNLEARFQLAFALRQAGRPGEAEEAFRHVIERQGQGTPNDERLRAEAHLQLGHLYLTELPNREAAMLHLNKFLATAAPDHPAREEVEIYLQETAQAAQRGPEPPPLPKTAE